MTSLAAAIIRVSRVRTLLVACDFDGTLSPIVDVPEAAWADPEAVRALVALGGLDRTSAIILSGRALADLHRRLGVLPGVAIIGSHGAEHDLSDATADPSLVAVRDEVAADVRRIAAAHAGTTIEVKPFGVALHYRLADDETAGRAVRAIEDGPGRHSAVCRILHGARVVELVIVPTNKGSALRSARERLGCAGVVFIGDDRTDEDAFAALAPGDLGIKVGSDPTVAGCRVADVKEVARTLGSLHGERLAAAASLPASGSMGPGPAGR